MIELNVNIDHVATVRQARKISEPDPVTAAGIVELAGADGITIHLREDRRHISDRDVRILKETIQTRMNLEMAATKEMFDIAIDILPDTVTLVPENREEVTTEGGLDLLNKNKIIQNGILKLKDLGIKVSLFIDPENSQIKESKLIGADDIELHTGSYANAARKTEMEKEFKRLSKAADFANNLNLQVNAGHGLNYSNVQKICSLPGLKELNIGHSIISRSIFIGISAAVKEMKEIITIN